MKKKIQEKKENIEETNAENAEEKIDKKERVKKQSQQLFWAIILMVGVIFLIIAVPYYITNYANKFHYVNLDFYKTKQGNITFYSTKIPIIDSNGKITGNYPLSLRSDPRKLEYISSIQSSEVKFIQNKKVYISINPNMTSCSTGVLAMFNLAGFVGGFGNMQLVGAVTDKNFAKDENKTFADCESKKDNTVILIYSGNQTKIEKLTETCYKLSFADCEIIPVTEKFDLLMLEGYTNYLKENKIIG